MILLYRADLVLPWEVDPLHVLFRFDRAGGKVVDVGPLGRNVGQPRCFAAVKRRSPAINTVLIDRDRVDEAEAKMDSARISISTSSRRCRPSRRTVILSMGRVAKIPICHCPLLVGRRDYPPRSGSAYAFRTLSMFAYSSCPSCDGTCLTFPSPTSRHRPEGPAKQTSRCHRRRSSQRTASPATRRPR